MAETLTQWQKVVTAGIAAGRSARSHVVAWKVWAQSYHWTIGVDGFQVFLGAVAACLVLSAVWWDGRLSARDVRSYAVSLLAPVPELQTPLPGPSTESLVGDTAGDVADLRRENDRLTNIVYEKSARIIELEGAALSSPPTPLATVTVPPACKPEVRWLRPKCPDPVAAYMESMDRSLRDLAK
jgi:hypothetical protein